MRRLTNTPGTPVLQTLTTCLARIFGSGVTLDKHSCKRSVDVTAGGVKHKPVVSLMWGCLCVMQSIPSALKRPAVQDKYSFLSHCLHSMPHNSFVFI